MKEEEIFFIVLGIFCVILGVMTFYSVKALQSIKPHNSMAAQLERQRRNLEINEICEQLDREREARTFVYRDNDEPV